LPTSAVPRPRSSWLALGAASRFLGVDPDTLRRWADSGRVPAFTTPGGHRRFLRSDLDRALAAKRSGRRSLATLGTTPERLVRAYARSYRAGGDLADVVSLDGDGREAFRTDGRRLVAAMVGFLDATDARTRARFQTEARAVVHATAARLAAAGADVLGVLSTFTAARRPFLAELASLGRRRSLDAAAITRLYDEATHLLDALQLDLMAEFLARSTPPASETRP
jgi:excisionase family DNA binding protein